MCKKYFFGTTSIYYSGAIFQGKSPLSLLGGISLGVSCLGVAVQRGIIQRKVFEVQTSMGQLPYGEFYEDNCPRGKCPRMGICPWEDFIVGNCPEGSCPGRIVQGQLSGGECPGVIVLGRIS